MAYQDGDTLAVVRMTASSGLLEDEIVNTFAFRQSIPPDEDDFHEMTQLIDDFYNTVPAGYSRPAHFISEMVSRSATHHIDYYKIQTGGLGSPIWTDDWLGPASPGSANLNLPSEVAAVLSFHGDLSGVLEEAGATRPKARRRGRIYFGPLTTDAIDTTQDSPLLRDSLLLPLRSNAVQLIDDSLTQSHVWCVWSRANAELYPVVGGWTDNAPDTQRRRGKASLSRVTFG